MIIGTRFSRLVVLERIASRNRRVTWRCICDCGNSCDVDTQRLESGNTRSCGCLRKEVTSKRRKTHGMTGSREYRIWLHMSNRCYNKRGKDYPQYGGRGIVVSPAWRDFSIFFADMGMAPEGKSIERVDNEKGYEKGNCRWATPTEQARNTRRNRYLTAFGRTMILRDWAREMGISDASLHQFLKKGIPLEHLL